MPDDRLFLRIKGSIADALSTPCLTDDDADVLLERVLDLVNERLFTLRSPEDERDWEPDA